MKLGIILDPLDRINIKKDSTWAMMVEAQQRGHEIFTMQQGDLAYADGQVVARMTPLQLTADVKHWYVAGAVIEQPLTALDLVLMRKDPPFDMEYIYSTYLLERAQQQGVKVFNDPRAVRDHNEKFAITEFADLIPPTLVARDAQRIRDFVAQQGDAILKPLDGMGGSRIFRVQQGDLNLNVIIETLTQHGSHTIMAQRYVPEIAQGDKRILLIGGAVVPYCLARIPTAGEHRGNLAAGGSGRVQPLSARDWEIARQLAPQMLQRGLLLVGLDVIGDYMTELNVTSPTCFQEISQGSDCNVASMMLDALEKASAA